MISSRSLKDLQLSKSTSKSRQSFNYRKLHRFTFTDLALSFAVRKRLYQMMITFNQKSTYQFYQHQIRKALYQMLDQTQSQIAYVVRNVFRYDTNQDGVITFQQFANFCLEQHFGQMAIQRLHKIGIYKRGKQRMMSQAQFARTIQFCFSFINIQPTKQALNQIFRDVDLDQDGHITYVEYFTLLKQYFGSQSQSVSSVSITKVQQQLIKLYGNVDKNIMKLQVFKQTKHQTDQDRLRQIMQRSMAQANKNVHFSAQKLQQLKNISQRISRLIYQQLRITLMEQDRPMLLRSNEQSAEQLLIKQMRIPQSFAKQIMAQAFQKDETISYERLLRFAVEKLMCQDVVNHVYKPITKQQFTDEIINNLQFLRAKPFTFVIEQLFQKYNSDRNKTQINRDQLKQLMEMIFSCYNWPRRTGELRKKQVNGSKTDTLKIIRL